MDHFSATRPARWQPCDSYEVGQWLGDGENLLAVRCYYYGEGMPDGTSRLHRPRPEGMHSLGRVTGAVFRGRIVDPHVDYR